jgi:hypothetical protein
VTEGDLMASLVDDGEGVPVFILIISHNCFTLTHPNARVLITKVTQTVAAIVFPDQTNDLVFLVLVSVLCQGMDDHVMHQVFHEWVFLFVGAETLFQAIFLDRPWGRWCHSPVCPASLVEQGLEWFVCRNPTCTIFRPGKSQEMSMQANFEPSLLPILEANTLCQKQMTATAVPMVWH